MYRYFRTGQNKYKKNHAWGYGLLAVAIYYGCSILFAIIIAFLIGYYSPSTLYGMNDLVLGLMGVPFGLLGVWGGYKLFERSFKKNKGDFTDSTLLDDDFSDFKEV